MTTRRSLAALWVVALIALGLRAWGVEYGLPSIAHDDERIYVANAVSMRERASPTVKSRGVAPYINPTAFTLVAAPITAAVDALSPRTEEAHTPRQRYRANRGPYHLAVRRLSVVLGVLTVLVLYWTARAFCAPRAALLAAALLAVSPLHVRDSHFATNDVALTLLMLSAFGVLLRLRGPKLLRRIALGGALFGAACATKYSAAPLLLPLLALLARRPAQERGQAFAVFLAASAAAFVLLFPAILLEPFVVVRSFLEQAAYGAQPWPGQDPGTTPWLHVKTLARALGLPGLGLAVWGLLGMLEKRRWILASYPVLHLMAILPLAMVFARFDLPLLPFLCLAVAYAVRRWTNSRWAPVLVAVLLATPTLMSVRISDLMSRPDTRQELATWLSHHLHERPLTVACERGTTLRFLPRGADGLFDPRLRVLSLSPGSCDLCGRPLDVQGARVSCRTAGCSRRGVSLEDPFLPARALRAMRENGVELVVLTSQGWNQPWFSELDRLLWHRETRISSAARPVSLGEAVLSISAADPVDGHGADSPVPSNHEERYGPWDNLWSRERPGPEIRVYDLRLPGE